MAGRTRPGRVVLAVLAGAFSAPWFVLIVTSLITITDWSADGAADFARSLGTTVVLSLIVGFPIALISIVVLFGPLWIVHHRLRGGFASFVLMACFAGLTMSCILSLFLPSSLEAILGLVLALTAATAPTSALIWWIAYGRKLGRDVPAEASVSPAEPSA